MSIKFINVYKSYSKPILEDFNLTIGKGLTILKGKSGSGKTTIFELVCNLVKPDKGQIIIDDNKNIDNVFQDKISILFANSLLNRHLSLKKNLDLLIYNGCQIDLDRFNSYVDKFNFNNKVNKKLSKLSVGNIKIAELIIVFSKKYSYLFLDEPFASLDYKSRKILKEIIFEVKKDKGVVLIDHSNYINENIDQVVDLDTNTITINSSNIEELEDNDKSVSLSKIQGKLNYAFKASFVDLIKNFSINLFNVIFISLTLIFATLTCLFIPKDNISYGNFIYDNDPYEYLSIYTDGDSLKDKRIPVFKFDSILFNNTIFDDLSFYLVGTNSVNENKIYGYRSLSSKYANSKFIYKDDENLINIDWSYSSISNLNYYLDPDCFYLFINLNQFDSFIKENKFRNIYFQDTNFGYETEQSICYEYGISIYFEGKSDVVDARYKFPVNFTNNDDVFGVSGLNKGEMVTLFGNNNDLYKISTNIDLSSEVTSSPKITCSLNYFEKFLAINNINGSGSIYQDLISKEDFDAKLFEGNFLYINTKLSWYSSKDISVLICFYLFLFFIILLAILLISYNFAIVFKKSKRKYDSYLLFGMPIKRRKLVDIISISSQILASVCISIIVSFLVTYIYNLRIFNVVFKSLSSLTDSLYSKLKGPLYYVSMNYLVYIVFLLIVLIIFVLEASIKFINKYKKSK